MIGRRDRGRPPVDTEQECLVGGIEVYRRMAQACSFAQPECRVLHVYGSSIGPPLQISRGSLRLWLTPGWLSQGVLEVFFLVWWDMLTAFFESNRKPAYRSCGAYHLGSPIYADGGACYSSSSITSLGLSTGEITCIQPSTKQKASSPKVAI